MSYIVHGVEIPRNCGGCDRKRVCAERIYLLRRPDSCPLEEIKTPHGRLIDAETKITIGIKGGLKVTTVDRLINEYAVKNVPTIIRAEGSET